jgi:hypothetical protein
VAIQEFGGGAPLEPEPAARAADQHAKHMTAVLRVNFYRRAQDGDAFIPLTELHEAMSEKQQRTHMSGIARDYLTKPLDGPCEFAFMK